MANKNNNINLGSVYDPSANSQTPRIEIQSLAHNETVKFFPYDFEIDDNFKPEWNTHDAFGRMDPVMIYKRTSRDITINFNVVSNSDEQSKINFTNLQKLINFLYPEYFIHNKQTQHGDEKAKEPAALEKAIAGGIISSEVSIIHKSPLMKIQFDNLLNNEKYIIAINNFKHKMKFDSASSFRELKDSKAKMVPGEFSISMSFKVLHTSDFEFTDFNRLYGG